MDMDEYIEEIIDLKKGIAVRDGVERKLTIYERKIKPFLPLISQWKKDGKTDKQIYTILNISHTSWQNYKNKYISLQNALEDGEDSIGMALEMKAYDKVMNNDSTKNNGLLWNMIERRNENYSRDEKESDVGKITALNVTISNGRMSDEERESIVADIEVPDAGS